MHGRVGIQSAMAIKRQRRVRERARRRRAMEKERKQSSSTTSVESLEMQPIRQPHQGVPEKNLASSVGMLHLGVCFLVLGLFLIGSGLLPDDMVTWRGTGWFNELVITGLFVVALAIFLIALNRILSKKEEEELEEYVVRQLTRSKSGHRLERDVETGCLTTPHYRRTMELQRENKNVNVTDDMPAVHSPRVVLKEEEFTYQNGEIRLEKIEEEDSTEKIDIVDRHGEHEIVRETISTTTTASLSPGSPSETRELIANGRSYSTRV